MQIKPRILLFGAAGLFIFKLAGSTTIGNCFAFAPDESNYRYFFDRAFAGEVVKGQTYWSASPLWFLKLIFLPATLLVNAGLESLLAFRFQAVFYFTATCILLYFFREGKKSTVQNIFKNPTTLFCILALALPSVALWSILGLRETFLYFGSTVAVASTMKILQKNHIKISPYQILVLSFALMLIGFTKYYVLEIIFLAFTLTSLFLVIKERNKNKAITLLVLPLLILLVTSPVASSSKTHSLKLDFNFKLSDLKNIYSGYPEEQITENTSQVASSLSECLLSNPNSFMAKMGIVFKASPKYTQNYKADSLPTHEQDFDENERRIFDFGRIPAGISLFLIGPLHFHIDSIIGVLHLIETILWVGIYYQLFRVRKLAFTKSNLQSNRVFLISFLLLFVIISSAVEINFGTALRHRSLILIPIAFILFYSQREKENSTQPN